VSATYDPYRRIAAYYDCEHESFRDDIDFYIAHIERGPVLEIGAGTGRVTAALGLSGLEVVGVDPSAAMLRRARARSRDLERVRLVEGTVYDIPGQPRFGTALFTLNVLWHLETQREQLATLREARQRLVPGGRLYIDLSNPLSLADAGVNGVQRTRYRGTCEEGRLDVSSAAWDDRANQVLTLAISYDLTAEDGFVRRSIADLTLRYTFRSELELMLPAAGFRIDDIFGSYDLDDYSEDGPNLLVVGSAI